MKKTASILVFVFAFFVPAFLWAAPLGLPFGGHVLFSMPCTCTPGVVRVQYDLLHPIPYPFVHRALLMTPATIRYAYQQFLVIPPPTAWHLGKFIPTPTPCLVGVPPTCAIFPTDGVMFDVGSSFPGFILF